VQLVHLGVFKIRASATPEICFILKIFVCDDSKEIRVSVSPDSFGGFQNIQLSAVNSSSQINISQVCLL
jgi:hypothetical protein